jgi:hypothetical protein
MMHVKFVRVLVVLAALSVPFGLRADADGAKAAYMRGIQKEKAKDYGAAANEYLAAVAAYPNYYWAYKQLGTCYYYMGNKPKAVEYYDKYLTYAPQDTAIKKFADSIRPAGSAAPAEVASSVGQVAPPLKHWGLGLDLGFNTYAMGDWNKVFSSGGSGTGGTINSGLGLAGDFRYRFTPSWWAGLNVGYLMASSTYTGPAGSGTTVNIGLPALLLGPEGGYSFENVLQHLNLNLGLGAGYLMLMGASSTGSSSGGGYSSSWTDTYSGSGFGMRIFGSADWYFLPSLSAGMTLGYRLASASSITDNYSSQFTYGGSTTSSSSSATLKNSDGSNSSFDYSGAEINLAITYWM